MKLEYIFEDNSENTKHCWVLLEHFKVLIEQGYIL